MKVSRFIFGMVVLSIFFMGCGSSRKMNNTSTVEKQEIKGLDAIIEKLQSRNDFGYFTTKGELQGTTRIGDQSASFIIQCKQDSMMIISVRKLGFEVFRAKITPDSAILLDRINQEVQRFSTSDYQEKFHVPFDHYLIQDLLTSGCYLSEYLKYFVSENDLSVKFEGVSELFQTMVQVDKQDYFPLQFNYLQQGRSATWKVIEKQMENSKVLQKKCSLVIQDPEEGKMSIFFVFDSWSFDRITNMKFDIPSHYKSN